MRRSAVRIFTYNWPVYAATWAGAAALLFVRGSAAPFAMAAAVVAAAWSGVSLLVSDYVYDRSPLAAGTWVTSLLPPSVATWATVDAGLDAEVDLDGVLPGRCVARLDVFDGAFVRAPSVARARARTPRRRSATACSPTALPLEDGTCDLVAIVFTAHEIRDGAARDVFFREVRRALRAGGRVLLVEHVRDLPNFLAFGPGFLHFAARAEWLAVAERAGLRAVAETRVTPWVMALALEEEAA